MTESEQLYRRDQAFKLFLPNNESLLRTATQQDCVNISTMITRNFQEDPTYADLPETVRSKYIASNTPEKILNSQNNPNSICDLIICNKEGDIIGYHTVRAVPHRIDNQLVACVRRLHISPEAKGQGLGKIFMQESEKLATMAGFNRMVVNASGHSYTFFSHIGYTEIARVDNRTFLAEGIQTTLAYMGKKL